MNYEKFKDLLKEELNRTFSILTEKIKRRKVSPDKLENKLRDYVNKKYGFSGDQLKRIFVNEGGGGVMSKYLLKAHVPEEIIDKENWQKFFERYGYFVLGFGDPVGYPIFVKGENVPIKLSPYKPEESSHPRFLFHITPKNKLLKIYKKGIVPKKSEKFYDIDEHRVYLVKDYRDSVRELASALRDYIPEKPPFGDEVVALKVDTEKIPGDIFVDTEIPSYGYYTKSNIPPSAIVQRDWDRFQDELEILKKRE